MTIYAAKHRARAARILGNKKLSERERHIGLWNYLITNEIEEGSIFIRAEPESQLYIVVGSNHEVMQLPRSGRGGDKWHAYFQTVYGYGEGESYAKFVYDALRSYALRNGVKVELKRLASFNTITKTAYLSAYNGKIFKVEGKSISTIVQGEDDVFFADDDGGEPSQEPEIKNHGLLLDRIARPNFITGTSGLSPDHQHMALVIWMFAAAFPELFPTKPVLLLEGKKGSGKTTVVKLLQLILQGVSRPINLKKSGEDDFPVQLLHNPIALIDNQDSYVDWLPDALCAYATGASWVKRKLYTDQDNSIIKPQAFVAFSTRNPASFRRDDVIDRCIILRFDRRTQFTKESKLEQDVLADRPKLLGEYLYWLGQIVEELRKDVAGHPDDDTYRMADLAAFSRVVGRVMQWNDDAVTNLMSSMQAERDAFLNEDDPLVELLGEWLDFRYQKGFRIPTNVGRLISVFDLHSSLETIAESRGIPWKESPRSLRLKMKASHIEREFTIEAHTLNKQPAFKIWRRGDVKLELVQGGITVEEE